MAPCGSVLGSSGEDALSSAYMASGAPRTRNELSTLIGASAVAGVASSDSSLDPPVVSPLSIDCTAIVEEECADASAPLDDESEEDVEDDEILMVVDQSVCELDVPLATPICVCNMLLLAERLAEVPAVALSEEMDVDSPDAEDAGTVAHSDRTTKRLRIAAVFRQLSTPAPLPRACATPACAVAPGTIGSLRDTAIASGPCI